MAAEATVVPASGVVETIAILSEHQQESAFDMRDLMYADRVLKLEGGRGVNLDVIPRRELMFRLAMIRKATAYVMAAFDELEWHSDEDCDFIPESEEQTDTIDVTDEMDTEAELEVQMSDGVDV